MTRIASVGIDRSTSCQSDCVTASGTSISARQAAKELDTLLARAEAAIRVLAAHEGQADYDSKARYIEYWQQHLGHLTIGQITADDILGNLPTHRTYKHKGPTPLKPATKNRYLATICTMLNTCAAWG